MTTQLEEPERSGTVGSHAVYQVRRTTVRTLELPLPADWTTTTLREGHQKLAQTAAKQQLQVLEPPLFELLANPVLDPPEAWTWRLLLPIRGRLDKEALAEPVTVGRTHGGTYVQATTAAGLPGLDRLYDYLFRTYLPRYKHVLTRPCLLHRVVDGIEIGDPRKLTIVVHVPVMLSLVRGELGPAVAIPRD